MQTAITYEIIKEFKYKSINIKQTPLCSVRLWKTPWWWHL